MVNIPSIICKDELLARFAFNSNEYFHAELKPKAKLFMPYKDLTTSVVRHLSYTKDEVWGFGQYIASHRSAGQLHGRADIKAEIVEQELRVASSPVDGIPNHADIIDWPQDKDARMEIAVFLAKEAQSFIPTPNSQP